MHNRVVHGCLTELYINALSCFDTVLFDTVLFCTMCRIVEAGPGDFMHMHDRVVHAFFLLLYVNALYSVFFDAL